MKFDETGIFWEPFRYQKQKPERDAPRPRILPPIPETGWKPRAHFPDLSAARVISLDTETCDPELLEKGPGVRRGAYIVGVSVATDDGFKGYYPVAHSMGENLAKEQVFAWLGDQLKRPGQAKVGANILYDLDFLAGSGIEVEGPFYDVLYADPLIYEYENSYSLDSVAARRIGKHKEGSLLYQWCADAYGGQANDEQRANIWRSPPSLVGPYAEADATLPLEVIRAQVPMLREMGCAQIFEMECKLIPLLLKLRRQGVPIDIERCNSVDAQLSGQIDTLEKELGFSVYSAEEIRQVCDREGIEYPRTPPSARFPDGQPSFTKQWLKAHPHPLMKKVQLLRTLFKMRDTFIRGSLLGTQINGRVHCEFHPLRSDDYGTVSGRFSSSHPNLQQIPIRDKFWGPLIRSCFIASGGRAWSKNDLSQIEFRLGVHFGLGEGIERVRHLYRTNPATDFYKVVSEISGLERDPSKSIALGTLYGMGVRKYAATTGVSLEKAHEQFGQFNRELPFMRRTYNHYADEAEQFGFVTTIGGRVCHLDEGYEHKALNRKLQGSCADWIKKAMLEAHEAGIFNELELYLTVHDELDTGLLPSAASAEAARELHRIMCNAYTLNIPVLAGCELGSSWGSLDDIEPEKLSASAIEQHVRR